MLLEQPEKEMSQDQLEQEMPLDQLKHEMSDAVFKRATSELQDTEIGNYTGKLVDVFRGYDKITGALADKTSLSGHCAGWCNTYPFGVPTSDIYPLLLAVCEGKNRLGWTLTYITKYCQNNYVISGFATKTVVLYTTKWDNEIFKTYEAELLRLSVTYNIHIYIFMVTDYGIKEIPFNWFCEYSRRRGKNVSILSTLFALHS